MIVVSYHTDTAGKSRVQALVDSARRFDVPVDTEGLPGRKGDRTRAEFIRRMLNKWADHDVLYVEAGGVFRRRPDLFVRPDFDVAAYVYRPAGGNRSQSGRFDGVGWIWPLTLFFSQGKRSRSILDRWTDANYSRPERDEMTNLLAFLAGEPITFRNLSNEYAWVERTMRPFQVDALPVIEHLAPAIPGAPARLTTEEVRPPIVVRAYTGLGDTFYARPVVKRLAARNGRIHLVSPWPQLFWDLPAVKVIRPPSSPFRAQRRNVETVESKVWSDAPSDGPGLLLEYTESDLRLKQTIIETFAAKARLDAHPGPEDFRFMVPEAWSDDWSRKLPRPIGIVHPPTIRKEWPNSSRNPHSKYIQTLIEEAPWVNWISVAWIDGDTERLAGAPLKGVTDRVEHGELTLEALVGLVAAADFVVTGPCFLLPLAAAVGTPAFVVFGGSVPPETLVDPIMGAAIRTIAPDPFCRCLEQAHDCRKEIEPERLVAEFDKFLRGLPL